MIEALVLSLMLSMQTECDQTWTFDANMHTLRNGIDVGGIGHSSFPFYRCVGGAEVWVVGQDGATWWRYNGNNSWSGPSGDPGGVVLGQEETLELGQSFTVAFDHDPRCVPDQTLNCTQDYHLEQDGTLVATAPRLAAPGTQQMAGRPFLTLGTHEIVVKAIGTEPGLVAASPTLRVRVVRGDPSKPAKPRIFQL